MAFDESAIECAEQSQGPAIPDSPGSFGTGAGWRQVIAGLGEGKRLEANLTTINDFGHLLPFTHSQKTADLVYRKVRKMEKGS